MAQELEKDSKQLNSLNASEAMLRTCVSRAYYASFHAATQYLESKKEYELKGSNEGSHKKVIELLQGDEDSKIRLVGENLYLLRNARTRVDYRLTCRELETIQLTKNEARMALKRSYEIIKILNLFMEGSLGNLK